MHYEEVADLLRRFVGGDVTPYEFDDFISLPQSNEKMEEFRLELIDLPENYPPENRSSYCNKEGISRILEMADEIEKLELRNYGDSNRELR